MASSWIKVEVITPDKPEIFQLAEILNIDPDTVLGKLIRVWVWADQQTIDGNADGNAVSVTRIGIDRITFMTGFADALITVGWLKHDGGKIYFPDFDRHNGKGSKKRAVTSRRVTEFRDSKAKSNVKGNAGGVTQQDQKALPEEELEEEKELKDKTLLSYGEKNATGPSENNFSSNREPEGQEAEAKNKRHEYSPEFEAAWLIYPRRPGSPDKHGAFKAWNARLRDGVTTDAMLEGVRRYAEFVKATGKAGTEFIKQAKTFFGPSKHFDDEWQVSTGENHVEFRFNQSDPRPYSEQYLSWEQQQGITGMEPMGSHDQNLCEPLDCEEWQSPV
ncbi:Uncharacterised protein [Yersinia frederiksenii]|uniref:Uncharacterized protein n=2 Tax=Yersinia frederiksenii TaxID=29484 RepID=A0A380PQP7_YERFR|nr:hypothetical protein [Yersinia frederiksenii]EEQ12700.1 hypothetical protein yfred0001_42720 [Yersinia frederiksenii ATCC 33641]KGA47321.1 hypothetical protein DJ58_2642 [Yersinia frederiksenii ATCC 33641]SUP75936.1 Uncharacterised protein [Yersinia frederiksenii]